MSNAASYQQLRDALNQGIPAATATIVCGEPLGAKLLVLPKETAGSLGSPGLDAQVAEDARALLLAEKSETRSYAAAAERELDVFIETFPPPPLLLIFGAVHIAQALTTFAKRMGYQVIVVDARAPLATPERFPEADRIIQAWPDEALQQLELPPNTSIAILTHDPKFDEPAILGSVATTARYIGAVGSRKTNAERRERLAAAGLTAEQLDRIHGPVGLDIGAETPEEMAISILGEMIAVRHGRSGGFLRSGSGQIRGDREPAAVS